MDRTVIGPIELESWRRLIRRANEAYNRYNKIDGGISDLLIINIKAQHISYFDKHFP